MEKAYQAQSARDAQAIGYGDKNYWDYLESKALELHEYFLLKGDHDKARLMLTQSIGEALMGNEGE